MFGFQAGSEQPGRRQTRQRKVSQRMAVVDDSTRQQVAWARLDALEADNDGMGDDMFGALGSDDEEFAMPGSDDDEGDLGRKGKKRKGGAAGGPKRKTRGQLADSRSSGPKSFARLLEESGIESAPPGVPNYLTAAAGPSVATAARKFCSVCGVTSSYTCPRCGSRYCTRKCFAVHTETRCLKFMA